MRVGIDKQTRVAGVAGVALALCACATRPLPARAADTVAPRGSVEGVRSPVRGALTVYVNADDDGIGLARAYAVIDGGSMLFVALDPACAGDSVPETGCAARVTRAPLSLDLTRLAVGPHRLQIGIVDGAGNGATVYDGTFAVAGPDPIYSSTIELAVGNPHASSAPGVVGGAGLPVEVPEAQCASPRLSMLLDQRPLAVRRGRLVLKAKRRYRFRGRLTCLVGATRKSAKPGTPVQLYTKVGRKTRRVSGATTRSNGRVTKIVSYRSSRTLIFRYESATAISRVRIPILVRKAGR